MRLPSNVVWLTAGIEECPSYQPALGASAPKAGFYENIASYQPLEAPRNGFRAIQHRNNAVFGAALPPPITHPTLFYGLSYDRRNALAKRRPVARNAYNAGV